MARLSNKLKASTVNSNNLKPGKYADGNGLYLMVSKAGNKTWSYLYTLNGRRRQMGLGRVYDVPLVDARDEVRAARNMVRRGIDPIDTRKTEKVPLFAEAIKSYFEAKGGELRGKNAYKWEHRLNVHAQSLHHLPVSHIDTRHIADALKDIWLAMPETANRTRMYIEKILNYSHVKGWRTEPGNPATRSLVTTLLPKQNKITKHRPALDWRELPKFMSELSTREAIAARMMEFLIYTACRPGEARGALWSEIDWDHQIWAIPAARMKMKRPHRVPLAHQAMDVLSFMRKQPRICDLIFPNPNSGKPYSMDTPRMLLKRMNRSNITAHGFRSTFSTWARENTEHTRAAVELSLAHAIGGETEAAYARGDLLEKRRGLMQDYADFSFSTTETCNKVINIHQD